MLAFTIVSEVPESMFMWIIPPPEVVAYRYVPSVVMVHAPSPVLYVCEASAQGECLAGYRAAPQADRAHVDPQRAAPVRSLDTSCSVSPTYVSVPFSFVYA